MSKYQVVISRNETIDVIGQALGVPAKVDSGAYRSSIHASDIKVVKKNGREVLTCKLLGHRASPEASDFETSEFGRAVVINSFGHREERYEVVLRVKLGPKVFNTSFTLADRSKNFYPVLIGRKLLKGRFLIDVSTSNVNRRQLKEQYGIYIPNDEEDME